MKIAILGYGTEGKAAEKFLKKHPDFKKSEITILDRKTDPNYLNDLQKFHLVIRSPGVPYNLGEIQYAVSHGIHFSSVTKLFFKYCPAKIIGITGSKGKGTTATLLYEILKYSGFDVHLAGNIGRAPLELLPKLKPESVVILELSSFQLQDLFESPHVAAVLDVFPEHQDHHKSVEEYYDAKANIARHQKKSDAIFYFKDNETAVRIASHGHGQKFGLAGHPFGLKKNFVMAAAIASYLGAPLDCVVAAFRKFKGLPHRLELVRKINNIEFYNDSLSTNPESAAMAIETLSRKPGKLILLAGGKDKGLDYSPLKKAISGNSKIMNVILFGENKAKIAHALQKAAPTETVSTMKLALRKAYNHAKKMAWPIHVVLSPGSASFDMFLDAKERGEQFKQAVRALK